MSEQDAKQATAQRTFPLRLAPDVRENLERVAEQNRRSLNAEIVVAIEQHVRRAIDQAQD